MCTHVTKGTLHASVFEDRLRQEHGASLIITSPTVPYKIIHKDGRAEIISNPALFPSGDHDFKQIERLEPYVFATITVPEEYLGKVIELCEVCRPFPWQGLLRILNHRRTGQSRHTGVNHFLDCKSGHFEVQIAPGSACQRLLWQTQGYLEGVWIFNPARAARYLIDLVTPHWITKKRATRSLTLSGSISL
jgi:hypothetical protein